MRPATDFGKLAGRARYRLKKIRAEIVTKCTGAATVPEIDRCVARAVIETQNVWSNFSRSYLLSCLSRPRRCSGGRIVMGNASANTPGNLLHIAVKACKGATASAPVTRRDEPAWHDTTNFLRSCTALAISNLAEVQAALSVQTRVFSDLPTFRNFYAHRNEETAGKAVTLARVHYLILGAKHPTEALLRPAHKRPQALLLDWLDEMEVVVDLLCE